MGWSVLHGDCRQVMANMHETFDAIVTDPPYELAFMNKTWDQSGVAFEVETWRKCYDLRKPGGYLLAFGGSRTYHRMACAIEDAGFEIRDQVMWVYGSGFPKSLDISKAIDKHGGKSVSWFGEWLRKWRAENGITQKEVAKLFPSKTGNMTGCVANWELGFNLPTAEQFTKICRTFNLPFESIEEAEREVIEQKRVHRNSASWETTKGMLAVGEQNFDTTAPATPEAQQWHGWGTALKPAHEPIVMARKPLEEKTVAGNVLKHGTGAINIDGCRVETDEQLKAGGNLRTNSGDTRQGKALGMFQDNTPNTYMQNDQGRFPANLIHDGSEEVVGEFPQTGASSDRPRNNKVPTGKGGIYGHYEPVVTHGHSDSGSAARFFKSCPADEADYACFIYCAKASKAERNMGCEGLEEKEYRLKDGLTEEEKQYVIGELKRLGVDI